MNFPGNGITAVVGPNGCGKSNIIDAIRWVLGEQRAKQLRSSKMEDVIFSGTAERPPMNFAEVSILINNDRGVLPSEYTEIQITRRAHRSGDSEYLINGQECRLKDIHNLFMDTGMGAASYSIMEQKMIDTILSTKADERRTLFEETAGISKYKQQRKETLKQLERTALDLDRVNDSLQHAKRNVSHFERQAKKAQEWRRIKSRIKELDLTLSDLEYQKQNADLAVLVNLVRQNEYDLEACRNKLSLYEAQIEEKKMLMIEEESAYREQEQIVIQLHLDRTTFEGELQRALDKLQNYAEQQNRSSLEADQIWTRLEHSFSQLNMAQHELVEAEKNSNNGAENQFEYLEEKRLKIQRDLDDSRQYQMELTQERMEWVQKIADLKQKISSAEQKRNFLIQQNAQYFQKKQDLEDRLSPLNEDIFELAEQVQSSESAWTSVQLQLEKTQEENTVLGREWEQIQSRSQVFEKEFAAVKSEHRVLEELLQNPHEGVSLNVQQILEKRPEMHLLKDLIDVESGFEEAAIWAMKGQEFALFAQNQQECAELLVDLTALNQGYAWILNQDWPAISPDFQLKKSGAICLAEKVTAKFKRPQSTESGSQTNVSGVWIENYFGSYWLVESREKAIEFSKEWASQGLTFFTAQGEYFNSQGAFWVGAGEVAQNSIFKRQNQFAALTEQKTQLESQLLEVQKEAQELHFRKQELVQELQEYTEKERQIRSTLNAIKPQYSVKMAQKESIVDQLDALKQQAPQSLDLEDELFEHDKNHLSEIEQKRADLEETFAVALQRRSDLEESLSELNRQIQGMQSSKLESMNRLSGLKHRVDLIQNTIESDEKLREKRLAEIEEFKAAEQLVREAEYELHQKLEALFERIQSQEHQRDRLKEIFDEKQSLLEETRLQIREMNTGIQEHSTLLHQNQTRKNGFEEKQNRLRERIFENYEIDLETDEFDRVEVDLQESPGELVDLMQELKDLGNVNPTALEDFEEEKARMESVEKQFDDLDRARLSLEKTIRKLDMVAKERFLSTFAQIQKNFQDVFSSLMKDGEARLTLQEGVDPLEADIEINARPTGKKMRGVQLLSGGERALTALSLLFALYMIKPSPYCILDEVDGPLDDANIGRFVQLLRRFSRQTQFIVVTHNKRTMAGADLLYGVTQEIKGISKTAAVNLDEASEMAH